MRESIPASFFPLRGLVSLAALCSLALAAGSAHAQDAAGKAATAAPKAEGEAAKKDAKAKEAKPVVKDGKPTKDAKKKPGKGSKTMKVGDIEFEAKPATLKTNMGTIKIDLYWRKSLIAGETKEDMEPEKGTANANVKNIMSAMEKDFYKGRIFHRVIDSFMIQAGMDAKMLDKDEGFKPAKLEATNGLKNQRGMVAMARTGVPDSATTQFFINLKDNVFLDAAPGNPGYTVIGKVTEGMDVVDKIAKVRTGQVKMYDNVPVKPVEIESFTLDK
jgi:peptidyl-prolyl cis-trans isomerase A (cyclophilin A)